MSDKFEMSLDDLGDLISEFKTMIDWAIQDIKDRSELPNDQVNVYLARDSQGRYIIADLYASYAAVNVAWLSLRVDQYKEKNG